MKRDAFIMTRQRCCLFIMMEKMNFSAFCTSGGKGSLFISSEILNMIFIFLSLLECNRRLRLFILPYPLAFKMKIKMDHCRNSMYYTFEFPSPRRLSFKIHRKCSYWKESKPLLNSIVITCVFLETGDLKIAVISADNK